MFVPLPRTHEPGFAISLRQDYGRQEATPGEGDASRNMNSAASRSWVRHRGRRESRRSLDIESKMHHIPILDDIRLPFLLHLPRFFGFSFT